MQPLDFSAGEEAARAGASVMQIVFGVVTAALSLTIGITGLAIAAYVLQFGGGPGIAPSGVTPGCHTLRGVEFCFTIEGFVSGVRVIFNPLAAFWNTTGVVMSATGTLVGTLLNLSLPAVGPVRWLGGDDRLVQHRVDIFGRTVAGANGSRALTEFTDYDTADIVGTGAAISLRDKGRTSVVCPANAFLDRAHIDANAQWGEDTAACKQFVLSVFNDTAGIIAMLSTPYQTTVNLVGNATVQIGTVQDLANISTPTFRNLNLTGAFLRLGNTASPVNTTTHPPLVLARQSTLSRTAFLYFEDCENGVCAAPLDDAREVAMLPEGVGIRPLLMVGGAPSGALESEARAAINAWPVDDAGLGALHLFAPGALNVDLPTVALVPAGATDAFLGLGTTARRDAPGLIVATDGDFTSYALRRYEDSVYLDHLDAAPGLVGVPRAATHALRMSPARAAFYTDELIVLGALSAGATTLGGDAAAREIPQLQLSAAGTGGRVTLGFQLSRAADGTSVWYAGDPENATRGYAWHKGGNTLQLLVSPAAPAGSVVSPQVVFSSDGTEVRAHMPMAAEDTLDVGGVATFYAPVFALDNLVVDGTSYLMGIEADGMISAYAGVNASGTLVTAGTLLVEGALAAGGLLTASGGITATSIGVTGAALLQALSVATQIAALGGINSTSASSYFREIYATNLSVTGTTVLQALSVATQIAALGGINSTGAASYFREIYATNLNVSGPTILNTLTASTIAGTSLSVTNMVVTGTMQVPGGVFNATATIVFPLGVQADFVYNPLALDVGWIDLTVSPTVRGSGSNNPPWTLFRDGIYAYEFRGSAPGVLLTEIWANFHIPHNYAVGRGMYFHIHWALAVAGVTAPAQYVQWNIEYTWAHGAAPSTAFGTTTVVSVQTAVNGTAYMHMISEIASPVLLSELEVDTLVLTRIYRDASLAGDTSASSAFLFAIDAHLPVNKIATPYRNKATGSFYT